MKLARAPNAADNVTPVRFVMILRCERGDKEIFCAQVAAYEEGVDPAERAADQVIS